MSSSPCRGLFPDYDRWRSIQYPLHNTHITAVPFSPNKHSSLTLWRASMLPPGVMLINRYKSSHYRTVYEACPTVPTGRLDHRDIYIDAKLAFEENRVYNLPIFLEMFCTIFKFFIDFNFELCWLNLWATGYLNSGYLNKVSIYLSIEWKTIEKQCFVSTMSAPQCASPPRLSARSYHHSTKNDVSVGMWKSWLCIVGIETGAPPLWSP